jgi:DNA invertase Pin-like site-specific DNA recombinase
MSKKETGTWYCRVSTEKQQNDWASLENQEKACKNLCHFNNIQLLKIFRDAISGKKRDRAGLREAIKFAIENKVDYFVIFDIDRLTREGYETYSYLKKELQTHWIALRDCKNVIWQERIIIEDDIVDMSQYEWNKENPTEINEMFSATNAKTEGKKILQRTITREIQLEQKWYQVRESNFWYTNKKIRNWDGKFIIQEKHHQEGDWMIAIFNLRAMGSIPDEEIIKQVNLMWYRSRTGKPLTVKQLQAYIKYPIYAWFRIWKWTWRKLVKTPYEWLVSIETWNRANRWKLQITKNIYQEYIIETPNTWVISSVKRRKKENPDFPLRNLIKSWLIKDRMFTGGYSGNGRTKMKFWYYHPLRKKWEKGENIKKEEFEHTVYSFLEGIHIPEEKKTLLAERFDIIFQKRKEELSKHKEAYKGQLVRIQKEFDDTRAKIRNINPSLTYILETLNTDLEELQKQKVEIEEKLKYYENSKIWEVRGFKEFCFNIIEHLWDLLQESQKHEEKETIFKFVFKEVPTYAEIVNRTPKMYSIFASVKEKEPSKIESSSENLLWQTKRDLYRTHTIEILDRVNGFSNTENWVNEFLEQIDTWYSLYQNVINKGLFQSISIPHRESILNNTSYICNERK